MQLSESSAMLMVKPHRRNKQGGRESFSRKIKLY